MLRRLARTRHRAGLDRSWRRANAIFCCAVAQPSSQPVMRGLAWVEAPRLRELACKPALMALSAPRPLATVVAVDASGVVRARGLTARRKCRPRETNGMAPSYCDSARLTFLGCHVLVDRLVQPENSADQTASSPSRAAPSRRPRRSTASTSSPEKPKQPAVPGEPCPASGNDPPAIRIRCVHRRSDPWRAGEWPIFRCRRRRRCHRRAGRASHQLQQRRLAGAVDAITHQRSRQRTWKSRPS